MALPKKTGVTPPRRNSSVSKALPAVSSSASSSLSCRWRVGPSASAISSSSSAPSVMGRESRAALGALEVQRAACASDRRRRRSSCPEPIGQLTGLQGMPSTRSISSSRSSGSLPSRSILLMKVMIGMPRIRQT